MSHFSGHGNGEEEGACVGEATIVAYGNGEEDASKGEASGKRKYSMAEYPCVKRLRQRRLLSFLWDKGFYGAFEALNDETPVLFSVRHIQRLVMQGRWADALVYLNAYLPPLTQRSRRAQIFHNFLLMNYRFANAVAGNGKNKDKSQLDKQYAHDLWCSTHAQLRFRRIAYTMLASEPHQLIDTYDWHKVRARAAVLVSFLADTTPELKRSMPLPSHYMMPQHVLPIGSSLNRRRHRVVKKKGPQKGHTEAIFMNFKSLQHSTLHRNWRVESPDEALEMLVNFLDQTLKAGLRAGRNLTYATQPCEKEGDKFLQTISRTSNVHSQNPGISSMENAGYRTANPSKEPATVEDDIYHKKQRTTGTFGEASSVSTFGGRASADTRTLG